MQRFEFLRNKKSLLLLLVLFISFGLRLYNINNLFVFTIDEEYLFNQAQTIVKDFHLIWIGLSVSVGFYMGPLPTYTTALLIYLFNDPIAGAYFAAILGTITTFFIYWTGKKLFSEKIGFTAALIYATLPLFVFYDQRYWNNTPIPLLSILLFLSLAKTATNPKWWVLYALGIGLMFHTNLTLFPYLLIGLVLFIYQIKKIPKKIISISVAIFLILYSPLLVFDFFHNWSNLTSPFRLKTDSPYKESSIDVLSHSRALFSTLGRFIYITPGSINVDESHWGCTSISGNNVPIYRDNYSTRTNPPFWISTLVVIAIAFFILRLKTWRDSSSRVLATSLFLFFGFFLIFPGGALEYYLLPIFPLIPLVLSLVIFSFSRIKRDILLGLLFIIIVFGIFSVFTSDPKLGIGSQKKIIDQVMKTVGNNSFELQEVGECRGYAGWRYLFKIYGNTPTKSSIDQTFGWLYPDELNNSKKNYYNVIVTEKRATPVNENKNLVNQFEEGGFAAYIYEKKDN